MDEFKFQHTSVPGADSRSGIPATTSFGIQNQTPQAQQQIAPNPVIRPPTQQVPPTTPPLNPPIPPPPKPQKPFSVPYKKIGVVLLVLAILTSGSFAAYRLHNHAGQVNNELASQSPSSNYNTLSIPLNDLANEGQLSLEGSHVLSINGQLTVNNSIVLTPTAQPTAPVSGQIYYNQSTNQLAYYNGSKFVNLLNSGDTVESLGGQSGVLTTGSGIAVNNLQLSNTGVLSLQGQTGALSLTNGGGIAVSGTTLTNTGVLSLGGQSGNLSVGNGLSVNNAGQLNNTGVLSVTSGSANLIVSNDGNGNLTISNNGAGTGTVASTGGTSGYIAKFVGTQEIADSLLSDNGTTVTVNGNLSVTGAINFSSPLSVTNGGTGVTTLTNDGVLIGQGTSGIATAAPTADDQCLLASPNTLPSFQQCPSDVGVTSLNGAQDDVVIANASATGQTINIDTASTTQLGLAQFNSTNFTVTNGNVNTVQDIDTAASPTFASINTNNLNPSGPLTVGSTSQTLTLQGSNTTLSATNGTNAAELTFVAPTANVVYRLQTAAAGTYDVCTTAGNCAGVGGGVTTTGGTNGDIAIFNGSQTIGNSIISQNGTTVTVGGTIDVSGALNLGSALSVANGGTGATNAAAARVNLGAAASGANSDITSLTGLTTALSVIQGGTGTTALTADGVLLGNGMSAITSLAAGSAGECLVSTSGAPVWQACPGSAGVTSVNGLNGALTIANATTSGSTITINSATTSTPGIASFNSTNFTVTSGNVNTIQDIDATASPTFASINTNAINPSGPLTVGSTLQNLSLQGAATTLSDTSGSDTTTLSFAAPTANVTYQLQTAAAGTYDVCTTAGNCTGVGGSVTTPGGTTNTIALFSGSQTLGNSIISQNTGGTTITVSGNLTVTGTLSLTNAPLAVTSGGTGATTVAGARSNLGAAASGANSDITSLSGLTTALSVIQGGTGATSLTANGILMGNGTGAISSLAASGAGECLVSTSTTPVWQACPGPGAVTSINGLSGAVTIANATASGSTVTINNATTSTPGIASFNSTNFTVSSGAVNTIQNINVAATPQFGTLTLSSSQASNPMLLVDNLDTSATGNLLDLQVNGSSELHVDSNGNLTLVGQVNGQSISSTASFSGTLAVTGVASLNGGASVTGTLNANTITPTSAMTVGSTSQNLLLQGNASTALTATSGSNTTTVGFQTPTANVTYQFQAAAAGTYSICTTAGNCSGVGGGVTTPGGTANTIALFTGSQVVGNSIITENSGGTSITIGGVLGVNTITPTSAMTVGSTSQNLTLQGATTSLSSTASGITNTLSFATPTTTNKTITVPNASGTLVVSASGPLSIDANGNITCSSCVTSGGGSGGQSSVDSVDGLQGALTIANTSGSGTNITINNASTSSEGIASFNASNFTVSSGVVDIIQDINTTAAPTFGQLTVTSSQATNNMLVVNNTDTSATGNLLDLELNGGNRFTVDPNGNVVAAGTITAGTVNGQTISSNANFTGTLALAGAASLNGGATVVGTLTANTITPSAAMTVGSTSQNLTLQGATTNLVANSGGNATTLTFQAPTANVTYRLLTETAGTYDICTTVGNCANIGGGVTTSGGTSGDIAMFTGAQTLGNSSISDNGTTVSVNENLSVTGSVTFTNALTIGNGGTGATTASGARANLGAAASGANSDITSLSGLTTALSVGQGGTGANSLTANGVLLGNGTSPLSSLVAGASNLCLLSTNGAPTWSTCPGSGGVTTLDGLNGNLTLANSTGTGSTITINTATNSQEGIASFNSNDLTVTSGSVDTVQGISTSSAPTFAGLNVTSSQATGQMLVVNNTDASATGNLLNLELNGNSLLSVAPSGTLTTGAIVSGTVNGQTISSNANFTNNVTIANNLNVDNNLAVTGTTNLATTNISGTLQVNTITPSAALTVGATNQTLTLQGSTTSLTSIANGYTDELTLDAPGVGATGGTVYHLQAAASPGTYNICTTVGNCTSIGGGVTTTGGTANTVAMFNGSQTLTNSIISQNTGATAININGNLNLSSGDQYEINGLQISSTNLSDSTNLARLNGQNIFKNTSNSSTALEVQNAAGYNVFNANTNTGLITLGNITTASGQGIAGVLDLADGTNDGYGLTLNTTTLSANQTISFPNASGTVCLQSSQSCGFAAATGGTGYIQNGTSAQSANFNVQAATSGSVAGVLEANASGSGDILDLKNGTGTIVSSFSSTGAVRLQTSTNSANGFTVQNAAGYNVLNANTTTGQITLGNITATSGQAVAGNLLFGDGTNDNFGLALNTTTLTANQTITLPNATGTLCIDSTTACGFILNQTSQQASSNFNISGTGIAATELETPTIDAATAASTLVVGASNANDVQIGTNSSNTKIDIDNGTGTINVGEDAAASSTINIENSANSGITKTINIGNVTAGVSKVTIGATSSATNTSNVIIESTGISDTYTGSTETIQTSTNSTAAFKIENSNANSILDIDTSNLAADFNGASSTQALNLSGGFDIQSLASPTITSVSQHGTAGSTTYKYEVVACDDGACNNPTLPSTPFTTTTGNATLSGSNYNIVNWNAVPGAEAYILYQTTGSNAPEYVGLTTNTTLSDTGGGYGFGPNSANESGSITSAGNINDGANLNVTGAGTIGTNLTVGNTTTTQFLAVNNNTDNSSAPSTAYVQGGITADELPTPSAPTVAAHGTTGSTHYTYYIAACATYCGGFDIGMEQTPVSVGTTITNGNASLSSTNYNQVNWNTVSGAAGYEIYRTVGGVNSLVAVATSSATSYNDAGTAVSTGVTLPTTNTTGDFEGYNAFFNNIDSDYAGESLDIGSNYASAIDLNQSTVLASGKTFTDDGAALIQTASNSSSALTVQNAAGYNIFNVDTNAGQVTLGNISTTTGHAIAGSLVFGDGTTDGYGLTVISSTLPANETLTLPNGTGTLCLQSSGSCGFILNQTSQQASSNFNISGTGIAGTELEAPLIDSSAALNIATSTASSLTLGRSTINTTVAGGNVYLSGNTSVSAGDTFSVVSGYATITGFSTTNSNPTLSIDSHSSGASPLVVKSAGTTVFTIANGGGAVFQNSTNSYQAFRVLNAAGYQTLNVSTSTGAVTVGNVTTASAQEVQGELVFADGTADNYGLTVQSTTLTGNQTITLPNATGTVCLQSSASCGFILNQTSQQASSNFNISGTGIAGTELETPLLDNAGALSIGTSNATSITIGHSSITTAINGSLTAGQSSLGDTTVGTTLGCCNDGVIDAQKVTTTTGGTISSISAYIGAGGVKASPNNQYQFAIYNNSGGAPGSYVASTAVGTLSTAGAWYTLPITATLSANTTYWIAYWTNDNTNDSNNTLLFQTGVTGTAFYFGTATWQGGADNGMPASFPTGGTTVNGYLSSMYASFSSNSALSVASGGNLTEQGSVLFEDPTNVPNAFEVENSSGNNVFNVNSATGQITFGNITSTSGASVAGTIVLADGTADNYGLSIVSSTLTANQTITLPNTTGTLCLQSSSACGFILNQTAQQASSNFNISGTGIAGTELETPALDTATNTTLNLGTANATAVNIGNSGLNDLTTIYGSLLDQTYATNSTTAFRVLSSTAASVFDVDTTDGRVGVDTSSTPSTQLVVAGDGTGYAQIGGGTGCGSNYTGISLNGLAFNNGTTGACNDYNIMSSPTDTNLYINRPTGENIYFRENNVNELTIAPGGATTLETTTNSTTGFTVNNSSVVPILTVDTQNGRVIIGNGTNGDTTGYLIVLDNKTSAGDPTQVNGAMYYNSATGQFRCGMNNTWASCIGIPTPNNARTMYAAYNGTNDTADSGTYNVSYPTSTNYEATFPTTGDTLMATSTHITPVAATSSSPEMGLFTSAAASGDTANLYSDTAIYNSSALPMTFQAYFKATTTTSVRDWLGMTNTGVGTMDGNSAPTASYVAFRYDTTAGDSDYQCVSSNGSSHTIVATTVTPTAGHKFEIDLTSSQAIYLIDGTVVCTITTNLPAANASMIMDIGGATETASAMTFDVGWVYVQTAF